MSAENVIQDEIKATPNDQITDEKKVYLLNEWKKKVEEEISDYNTEKDKIYSGYKKQKEKFDKILGVKLKKMKKYDGLIINRKKVLADILKEIDNLNKTPTTS
jgi:hypothetical protein